MISYNEVVDVYKNLGHFFRIPGVIRINQITEANNDLHYSLTSDGKRTIADVIDPGSGAIRRTAIIERPIEDVTDAHVRNIFS